MIMIIIPTLINREEKNNAMRKIVKMVITLLFLLTLIIITIIEEIIITIPTVTIRIEKGYTQRGVTSLLLRVVISTRDSNVILLLLLYRATKILTVMVVGMT